MDSSRTLVLGWAVVLSFCCAAPVEAGFGESFVKQGDTLELSKDPITTTPTAQYVNPPLDKLNRGVTNMLSSPLEIPATIAEWRKQRGWLPAATIAPFAGVGRFCVRLVSGTVDVLTFPAPTMPRRAVLVRRASLFYDPTVRAEWVLGEARTTQQELSETTPPRITP